MSDIESSNEFRLKGSSTILNYIRKFSATEKAVFGLFALALLITALIMTVRVNENFMTRVPAYGGELREGEIGLPRTVNPVLAITDADRDISSLVYAGLMKYKDGGLVTDIAASYSISEDGLTYDFKLRQGIRFQDSAPLTADDLAFTIQKIQDPVLKSPRRSDWANVIVRVISPTEIQFVLKQAYSPFLTNTTLGIMPKHIWGTVSDDQFIFSEYNVKPIGAGAYKVASISRDSGGIPTQYRLTTWSDYYGTTPYISTLSFNFFADEAKALAALDNGTIDSLAAVSAAPAARLVSEAAEPYTILSTPLPRIFGVFWNQSHNPILADKNIRQALDMAAPRTAIVQSVLNGYGLPIHGPLPAGLVSAYISSTSPQTATTTADIEGAKTLLEKNGWRKGIDGIYAKKSGKAATTTLSFELFTADTPDLKETADLLQKSWVALGARVSVKIFESGDLYQNIIRTRAYDALLFGEQIGKDRDLYAFWHSSQRNAPGLNVALYANSKADKLLETIRTENDPVTRAGEYSELDGIIRADNPAVFLYSPDFIYAVPKSLQGISLSAVTTPTDRFNSIASWYKETEKVWSIFAKGNQ